jgi:hypothetical protein
MSKALAQHREKLLAMRAEILSQGDIAIEPSRTDAAAVGADEDEQALNEMNQVIASRRNRLRTGDLGRIQAALKRLDENPAGAIDSSMHAPRRGGCWRSEDPPMEGGDDQGGVKGGERARGGSVSRIALGMRWADWDLQPAKRLAVRNRQRALAGSTG